MRNVQKPDPFFFYMFSKASNPRFIGENLEKNKNIYNRIESLAKKHQSSPAQLALAWVLHQGDDVVPIPGEPSLHFCYLQLKLTNMPKVIRDRTLIMLLSDSMLYTNSSRVKKSSYIPCP